MEIGVSDRTRQQPRLESYGAVWTSTELCDRLRESILKPGVSLLVYRIALGTMERSIAN
ncbi:MULTISPECIES: hypothetical protein [Kamptonema]|uniref:hypothetical protein n=1 Tax=Kamptonema TaxID=1501433 RepID=UPI0001DAD415|nr:MULTISPECIES: hypothetical protein [Kamptonema]CBN53543.1 hypothetical protein OSCI_10010 [Kamptonema sp. PCC 6506]